MKFVSFIAMLCAAFVLSAAETAIWDGTQASVNTGNKATTATAADGVLTLSGKTIAVSGKISSKLSSIAKVEFIGVQTKTKLQSLSIS